MSGTIFIEFLALKNPYMQNVGVICGGHITAESPIFVIALNYYSTYVFSHKFSHKFTHNASDACEYVSQVMDKNTAVRQ